MALFLQILGALCLAVVVLVALFALAVIMGRRLIAAKLGDTLGDFKYLYVPPRLHLVPHDTVEWKNAEEVERLTAPLHAAGFRTAGDFGTRELDYLRIRALAHPGESAYALIYEH